MPCYYPISAYQRDPEGGPLLFAAETWGATQRGGAYRRLQIACGQCRGCRLKRSREWAIRCMHEKQMHRYNSYITLTLNAENVPCDYSLDHHIFQRFLKRLRKAASKRGRGETPFLTGNTSLNGRYPSGREGQAKANLKFYMCGEYGEQHGRPHYHALLFGVDFKDKLYFRTSPSGSKIYTSQTLERLWPFGFSSLGDVTFESAAYIARYVMKKRTGDGELTDYKILDLETGEIHSRKKEYNQMSRRPGIGSSWINKFASDVYTTGKVIIRGHPNNPPRYYDKLYLELDQAQLEHIKHARYIEALAHTEHRTPERLRVQELVAEAKTKRLQRHL